MPGLYRKREDRLCEKALNWLNIRKYFSKILLAGPLASMGEDGYFV